MQQRWCFTPPELTSAAIHPTLINAVGVLCHVLCHVLCCTQIMKSDEDVRMISAEAPVLFAKVGHIVGWLPYS